MATPPPAEPTRTSLPIPTLSALVIATAMSICAIMFPQDFMAIITRINKQFMETVAEGVVMVSSLLLLACVAIAISPWGRIRLGLHDDKPEFSTPTWLAMLFAAGMGAGLLYWGVAEPMYHLQNQPFFPSADTPNAPRMAMMISNLHWGLHPWGIYCAGALCIAFFSFTKGFSMQPSSPFRAALPKHHRLSRTAADIIDVICVISLLLGLTASLTIGSSQVASGTQWLGNPIESTLVNNSLVLALIVITYLLSASTKLQQGIKRLSELNMILAFAMLIGLCLLAPIGPIWQTLWQSAADYFHYLPRLSFTAMEAPGNPDWVHTWTANYLLSWIAWVPFVGIFVARISRGRTIREFVLGVVAAPSLFTLVWFAALGGTALDTQATGAADLLALIDAGKSSSALFAMLDTLPLANLLFALVVVLVFIFLVTSADSASYVLAMIAGGGNAHPSRNAKLFWGVALGLMVTGTLLSQSGVHAVRALFSFAGTAVFFILIGQMACLIWGLTGHSRSKRDDIEFE